MKKLLLIIPYFGEKPKWFNFFLCSLSHNPEIDWMLITDFEIHSKPKNCIHLHTKYDHYRNFICNKLGINFSNPSPYKLCDLKPAYGFLHYDYVLNYQFWGYSDIDLVYGNILDKYDHLLNEFDVISSHTWLLAGHLSIFRTSNETVSLFSTHPQWKDAFLSPNSVHFDEILMTQHLFPGINLNFLRYREKLIFSRQVDKVNLKIIFKEQFTTFMGVDLLLPDGNLSRPKEWVWDSGCVTNDAMTDSTIYSHFSFWQSGKYNENNDPDAGIWKRNADTSFPEIKWDEIGKFKISKDGFSLF